MTLVWREQMSVHNRLIDKEHKYLIDQINALEVAINSKDNHDILIEILNHLMDYTKTHFEHEEVIQQKIDYPEIAKHKEEHHRLIKEFTAIKVKLDEILLTEDSSDSNEPQQDDNITDDELNDLLSDESPDESLSEKDLEPLVELMRHWLVDHIIGSDLKLKPLLQKHPVDLSFD
jgi:hemerythrin